MAYTENSRKLVPPTVAFGHEVSAYDYSDLVSNHSGDLTATLTNVGMGVMKSAGKIRQVYFMLAAGDQEEDVALSVSVDVMINGTSVCTTDPSMTYASGEGSGRRSTLVSGEWDGIVVADLDDDNRTYTRNDTISYTATVVSTSPDTEMQGFCVTVEREPILPT